MHQRCLDDAASRRENITVAGVSMPLGLWPGNWASSLLSSHVFLIVAQEVLGIETTMGEGSDYELLRMDALGGCHMPHGGCLEDPSKDAAERRHHVGLEMWSDRQVNHDWMTKRSDRAPVDLGSIGYLGTQGTFIEASVVDFAMNTEGLSLNVFTAYNASWYGPSKFFSTIFELNTTSLLTCRQRTYTSPSVATTASHFPDDVEGYKKSADGAWTPTCFYDHWWLSPACRAEPHHCVPWLTNAEGWFYTSVMQQSTAYNMPIALASLAAKTSSLLGQYRVLHYGWTPDVAPPKAMTYLMFPPGNATEHKRGLVKTTDLNWFLAKRVMNGLDDPKLAPVLSFIRDMAISDGAIQHMLQNFAAGSTYYASACNWLRRDSTWKTWIPSSTKCFAGQGLVDDAGKFVTSRSNATSCKWCPTGMRGVPDASQASYICELCPPGKFGNAVGATACQPCQRGSFTDSAGQSDCNRCTSGSYSDSEGASECLSCPSSSVTDGQGATNISDCVCRKGAYAAREEHKKQCEPCGWYRTTESLGASTENQCMLDGNRIALHTAVASAIIAILAALYCSHRYRKRVRQQGIQKALKQGIEAISGTKHPMAVIPLTFFLELSIEEVARCYESARDEGRLLQLDSAEDIVLFKRTGRRILFFSYTWLSWARLGPDPQQLSLMQQAARQLCQEKGIAPKRLYIWLDILCIPQANSFCKSLAVSRLYVYASQSDYLVVVCPRIPHEESGEISGSESVKSRLWCRVEQVAHCCNNGLTGMYMCAGEGELVPITMEWIHDVIHIFDGELSCCRLMHPDRSPCDRELLVPTGLAMYADMVLKYKENRLTDDILATVWPLLIGNRDQIFPKAFMYHGQGRRGPRSSRRFLFGSMMDSVAEIVSDPSFNTEAVHSFWSVSSAESELRTARNRRSKMVMTALAKKLQRSVSGSLATLSSVNSAELRQRVSNAAMSSTMSAVSSRRRGFMSEIRSDRTSSSLRATLHCQVGMEHLFMMRTATHIHQRDLENQISLTTQVQSDPEIQISVKTIVTGHEDVESRLGLRTTTQPHGRLRTIATEEDADALCGEGCTILKCSI
eukprot:TRINITY_DN31548_c0_g2_i3.p1 TRINITY_DN31548_c0_g2~~TRINITY_DN31548_c0_g2_i3.p1  ORF type:complete len:1076 (+),score=49.28 TRINITY_DN31548_c0_g2_i3:174-3401(+)